MTDDMKRLAGLVQLTGAQFRAVEAEMTALQQQEAQLRNSLAQLMKRRQTSSVSTCASETAAMIAGSDVRWQQWVDQRRAVINAELAKVLVAKEKCRSRLQRAFGRDQATQALRNRIEKQQQAVALRRRTYES